MSQEAWNRWGPEDERGALNFIGPEEVKRATTLAQTGEVLRLAQHLSSKTPVPQHRCGLQHFMGRDGGDYAIAGTRRPGGFQMAEDTVVMPLHIGTHVDALCHAWYDDKLYNGYLGDTIRSNGAARLGMEKMPPVVTRGVLLDIVKLKGRQLAAGESITASDLQAACAATGVTPGRGDAVLIRTGWLESQKGVRQPDFNSEPGIEITAARWLATRDVAIVGADNYAVEVLPFAEGTVFPVHQCLIRDYGVPLLEGLMLDPLVASGRHEFLFMASALPIVGATGSPLAPVVVL